MAAVDFKDSPPWIHLSLHLLLQLGLGPTRPGVEFTKSISGARPHPNPRCRDAIREQIAAP
jgi:hypothetical protein